MTRIDIVEIQHALKKAEDRLAGPGIPKKAWTGITITVFGTKLTLTDTGDRRSHLVLSESAMDKAKKGGKAK